MICSIDVYQAARRGIACLIAIGALTTFAHTQAPENGSYFARRNAIGVLAAYSPDSSHILLGAAEKRKLVELGISYARRLVLNRVVNWQYSFEFLPVALEGDPLGVDATSQTSPIVSTTIFGGVPATTCAPSTISYSFVEPNGVTYAGTGTFYCQGRQWTNGEAMSPLGMQWNFRPRSERQLFVDGHGGTMYSTLPIPIAMAGSFNFTFDIGAGLEVYRSQRTSIRAEYRYHHISNHDTAQFNPGIDNGLYQLTYCFGR